MWVSGLKGLRLNPVHFGLVVLISFLVSLIHHRAEDATLLLSLVLDQALASPQ